MNHGSELSERSFWFCFGEGSHGIPYLLKKMQVKYGDVYGKSLHVHTYIGCTNIFILVCAAHPSTAMLARRKHRAAPLLTRACCGAVGSTAPGMRHQPSSPLQQEGTQGERDPHETTCTRTNTERVTILVEVYQVEAGLMPKWPV